MIGNNKRIAKNTILLYFRMLFIMIVSLYTVRIVLNTLGAIDYGIYNVVGGIVSMFGIFTTTMASASQRFFSYELGLNNKRNLQQIFSLNLIIYIGLSLFVILLAETIGLWFLNTHLNIPKDRLYAANFVYQFSVFLFVSNLIAIPYNALVIAYEKMSFFAYVSIFEVLSKLLVIYLLLRTSFDRLIFYSVLMCIIGYISLIIYWFYCFKKFFVSHFIFFWNKRKFNELIGYTGWNLFGSITTVLNTQGLSILINLFFGPIFNSAKAISDRVSYTISSFSTNFYLAVNPQIIKLYASGDIESMTALVFQSSKISYYMLLVLSLPLILKTEYVLSLWLGTVDYNMIVFTRLSLIYSLINILENPITQMVRATGKIKKYQIYVGAITLLLIPVCYFLFLNGFSAETSLYILIIIYIVVLYVRLCVVGKQFELSIKTYLDNVLKYVVIVSVISFILSYYIYLYSKDIFLNFLLTSAIVVFITILIAYLLGLSRKEKLTIKNYLYNKILKIKIPD